VIEAWYPQASRRDQLIILPRLLCPGVGMIVEAVVVLHSRAEISMGPVEGLRKLL